MKNTEEKIRTYLASHLDFIAKDLTLIEEEFYLKSYWGSKGYVDILAIDKLQNYVIIEIKRSNQSARQTLNEVNKYAGLIKQQFRVKESEIRIIIVSTKWNELIIPFSELVKYSNYHVEGYRILSNDDCIPLSKGVVEPVEYAAERNISPQHMIFLFSEKDKIYKTVSTLKNQLNRLGLADFIILTIESKKKYHTPMVFI